MEVLVDIHEQLNSGTHLGKELLVVLRFGAGSSLQNFHVAF